MVSASSSRTSQPLSASARATASPTTPAPMTTQSIRSAMDASLPGEDLARVHDVVGIDRVLDPPHEVELDRIRVPLELEHLELTDAVFGADRAAELPHQIVDRATQ